MQRSFIDMGDDRLTRVYKSAELSECGRYRWWLRRSWDGGDGRVVCFVMLNPSTADASIDDPTIRRCIGFARAWGFSTLSVRNLFAFRSTDPAGLITAIDPIGGERGDMELRAARTADVIVAAWGADVPRVRLRHALALLGTDLYCLGTTKAGQPRHPLYVRADQPLVPFVSPLASPAGPR